MFFQILPPHYNVCFSMLTITKTKYLSYLSLFISFCSPTITVVIAFFYVVFRVSLFLCKRYLFYPYKTVVVFIVQALTLFIPTLAMVKTLNLQDFNRFDAQKIKVKKNRNFHHLLVIAYFCLIFLLSLKQNDSRFWFLSCMIVLGS